MGNAGKVCCRILVVICLLIILSLTFWLVAEVIRQKIIDDKWDLVILITYKWINWNLVILLPALAWGIYVTVAVVFGLVGACSGNRCQLTAYAVLISLVVLVSGALLCGGAYVFITWAQIRTGVERNMRYRLCHYPGFNNSHDYDWQSDDQKAWDDMQFQFSCCGTDGPSSWEYRRANWCNNKRDGEYVVPVTCCVLNNNDPAHPQPVDLYQCQMDAKQGRSYSPFLHTKGCLPHVMARITGIATLGTSLGGVIMIVAVLSMVMACCVQANKKTNAVAPADHAADCIKPIGHVSGSVPSTGCAHVADTVNTAGYVSMKQCQCAHLSGQMPGCSQPIGPGSNSAHPAGYMPFFIYPTGHVPFDAHPAESLPAKECQCHQA